MRHIFLLAICTIALCMFSCGSRFIESDPQSAKLFSLRGKEKNTLISDLKCSLDFENLKNFKVDSFSLESSEDFGPLKEHLLTMAKMAVFGNALALNPHFIFAQKMSLKNEDRDKALTLFSNPQKEDLKIFFTCSLNEENEVLNELPEMLFFLKKTQKDFILASTLQKKFEEESKESDPTTDIASIENWQQTKTYHAANSLASLSDVIRDSSSFKYQVFLSNLQDIHKLLKGELDLLLTPNLSEDESAEYSKSAMSFINNSILFQQDKEIQEKLLEVFSHDRISWDNHYGLSPEKTVCLSLSQDGHIKNPNSSNIFICAKTYDILRSTLRIKFNSKIPITSEFDKTRNPQDIINLQRFGYINIYQDGSNFDTGFNEKAAYELPFLDSFSSVIIRPIENVKECDSLSIASYENQWFLLLDGKRVNKNDIQVRIDEHQLRLDIKNSMRVYSHYHELFVYMLRNSSGAKCFHEVTILGP